MIFCSPSRTREVVKYLPLLRVCVDVKQKKRKKSQRRPCKQWLTQGSAQKLHPLLSLINNRFKSPWKKSILCAVCVWYRGRGWWENKQRRERAPSTSTSPPQTVMCPLRTVSSSFLWPLLERPRNTFHSSIHLFQQKTMRRRDEEKRREELYFECTRDSAHEKHSRPAY